MKIFRKETENTVKTSDVKGGGKKKGEICYVRRKT